MQHETPKPTVFSLFDNLVWISHQKDQIVLHVRQQAKPQPLLFVLIAKSFLSHAVCLHQQKNCFENKCLSLSA